MKNTVTRWEREASARGVAFYDSTFDRPFLWILNKRLSILIFQWTTRCWSLDGSDTLVGLTMSLLPLPVCLGFLPPGAGPPITLQVPPHCSCASLPKGHGGELPSLLWPGVLGCLCSTWLCGLLFFRERMSTARLGGGKIKVSPSE